MFVSRHRIRNTTPSSTSIGCVINRGDHHLDVGRRNAMGSAHEAVGRTLPLPTLDSSVSI
ncbi:hypothetical protein BDM02DRAFT_3121880 [Thelephora ganbajun]|uniref:Uncharacterized protein n=1 Tax=Thelephora ganbajun TaxID=370292 RepID=A0ACB6Z5L6_THEGA|nr:hypothetical protein BDM02DRAFT_3121880 [Thelephora ganbajun]